MRDYVIFTDSACDLEKSFRDKYDLKCVYQRYILNGKDYEADMDWQQNSPKQFYDYIREGVRITTSQVPQMDYKAKFTEYLEKGYDILYVGCSSALSAGVKSSTIVANELMQKYEGSKIICVDALRACFALGILAIQAAENKQNGMNIEENAAWLEEHKLNVNMEGSVEKLVYLKRAGRVSSFSAFFGDMLSIKPIIIADALGMNHALEKVKGRKVSLKRIAERVASSYEDVPYQKVFISHADCLEDAETLKQLIFESLGKEIDIHIGYVGACIGATVGPGMIGVYYFGKKVTVNAPDNN
ncbi:MAG: DegV family protein [Clostridiales bacterium]|nr:DegV family protein [Clostridiales bacterium]